MPPNFLATLSKRIVARLRAWDCGGSVTAGGGAQLTEPQKRSCVVITALENKNARDGDPCGRNSQSAFIHTFFRVWSSTEFQNLRKRVQAGTQVAEAG
jgi:hypothetical protein